VLEVTVTNVEERASTARKLVEHVERFQHRVMPHERP